MTAMQKRRALSGAAALAIALSGCMKNQPAADGNAAANVAAPADTSAIKDQIKADEKKWNDLFHDKAHRNAGMANQFYTDDAFFVGPSIKGTSGIDSIKKAYADGLKDQNFDINFASDKIDVAASGDLAASRGHFSQTYTDPNTKQVKSVSGSYLTVWKKQPDGSWKAVEDFAATDPTG